MEPNGIDGGIKGRGSMNSDHYLFLNFTFYTRATQNISSQPVCCIHSSDTDNDGKDDNADGKRKVQDEFFSE